MLTRRTTLALVAQRGTSLVELMVGLLVGLVVAVAVLQTFAIAEGRKRNTTGIADVQQTGLLALFTVATEIANAGNGLAAAATELATCPDTGDIRTSQRPVPVLITAGAAANTPDSVVVSYGVANAHAAPAPFASAAPAASSFHVHSAMGLMPNDQVVAISLTGHCAVATATSVTAPDMNGVVEIGHAGAADAYPASSVLLNLGPRSRVARVRYDIVDTSLRSLDLVNPDATPNPLVSNVVNMKAQYGIDADNDGFLDTWVPATNPDWVPGNVLSASLSTLLRIKAIRVGFIVRSETYDPEVIRAFDWVLFDCASIDKTQCPGRLAGTLPPGRRYRLYETVIPLRNQIWNGSHEG
jgi:type IV pilus assembly protein PilW